MRLLTAVPVASSFVEGLTQGCQMNISIKSQTVLKRGQKKAKAIV